MTVSIPRSPNPGRLFIDGGYFGVGIPALESNMQVRVFNMIRESQVRNIGIKTATKQKSGAGAFQRTADVEFQVETSPSTKKDVSILLLPAELMDTVNAQGLDLALTGDDECLRCFAAFLQSLQKRAIQEDENDEPPF